MLSEDHQQKYLSAFHTFTNPNVYLSNVGMCFTGRSPVDTRGGQLEIAGVVVGSWGPNLSGGHGNGGNGGGRGGRGMGPRVMAVGNQRRGYPK